jgi:hypothetical protein
MYDPAMAQQHLMAGVRMGGFSGSEDYTHYPYPDEYLNERNRQYVASNGDPYAAVNKPRQQRLDSDCKSCNRIILNIPCFYHGLIIFQTLSMVMSVVFQIPSSNMKWMVANKNSNNSNSNIRCNT